MQPTKVVAGPMDAFITRSRSTPLPKPIGRPTSGPSRLSDQHLFSNKLKREDEPGPSRHIALVKSKFFGGAKTAVQELEDAIKAAKEEIVWERSDGPNIESQEPDDLPRRPASSPGFIAESLRSPTPTRSSPGRMGETAPFTSPAQSRCSTPAVSSPVNIDEDDVFSPTGSAAPHRSSTPASPTRTTVATSQPLVEETQLESQESPAGSRGASVDVVIETPRPVRLSTLSSFHSILVPTSSPLTDGRSARAVIATSSETVEEEQEVVTPSMDLSRVVSRSTGSNLSSGKKRKSMSGITVTRGSENEPPGYEADGIVDFDEEDEMRKRRAKVVAAGWRKKYSLDASFPKPRSTRVHQDSPVGAVGLRRDPDGSPPPPKALNERSPNVLEVVGAPPDVAEMEATPGLEDRVRRVKEEAVTPVRSPLSAFQPVRMFSSLERFKYNGKSKVKSD